MKKTIDRIGSAILGGAHSLCFLAAWLTGAIADKTLTLAGSAGCALAGSEGEGYVDTAVKILMAVVIGALVLAGLYALFGDTVMPTLTQRIQEMFDYGAH